MRGKMDDSDDVACLASNEERLMRLGQCCEMMMMYFICSCRNKLGAELHIYLEQGTYHKRLFRGPSTNDMKK
jgi:hypothetical protein